MLIMDLTSVLWLNTEIDLLHNPRLILKLYFFMSYFPYNRKKMVPGLARAMERTTNLSIIFSHNLYISEPCKKSEDNFIAIRKFTSCYNIKIFNRLLDKF